MIKHILTMTLFVVLFFQHASAQFYVPKKGENLSTFKSYNVCVQQFDYSSIDDSDEVRAIQNFVSKVMTAIKVGKTLVDIYSGGSTLVVQQAVEKFVVNGLLEAMSKHASKIAGDNPIAQQVASMVKEKGVEYASEYLKDNNVSLEQLLETSETSKTAQKIDSIMPFINMAISMKYASPDVQISVNKDMNVEVSKKFMKRSHVFENTKSGQLDNPFCVVVKNFQPLEMIVSEVDNFQDPLTLQYCCHFN